MYFFTLISTGKNAYFLRILRLFLKKHTFKSMWIKKQYVCTMEYYSATNRNKIRSSVEMWVDLKSVIQSEPSQRNRYQMLRHLCGL